jgi:DUF1680 family protein
MKRTLSIIVFALAAYPQGVKVSDYGVFPVSYKDVQVTDSFWAPRIENIRAVSLPGLLDRAEKSGRSPDLRLIEAACYVLVNKPDPALKDRVDQKLDKLIAEIRARKGKWSTTGDGDGFWCGNFLEASVAYYEATGSRKMLDAAIEIADDLDNFYGPGRHRDIPNHEGLEIGLVRLFRATRNAKYLNLARFLIDTRGNPEGRTGLYGPYAQDHLPVKAQTRAIGHAVRATYLYIPLTDIAALTGDAAYARADERIWEDAINKRTFVTGGIGSYRDEEDYGDDYDLPNVSAWNEICAAYGNTFWNQRLFQLYQDAKYVDVLERTLYNALLVGVSLTGDMYLYQAPLRTYGSFARQRAFGPNCCPPNIARILPQLGGLIYARNDQSLYVNLYIGSKANIQLKDTPVAVAQETSYPWDGAVKLTVSPKQPQRFAVYVRIPGWARNQPVPGTLYRYLAAAGAEVTLSVNGAPFAYTVARGYARIERNWKAGDTVQINMPMPVRKVVASDLVPDDRGMVAFERGPLVYCAEQADNPAGVFNLQVPESTDLQFSFRKNLLGGIGTITGSVNALSRAADGNAVTRKSQAFSAIPFYAIGNRTTGEMSVWLARDEAKAVIAPKTSIASTSKATSSCGNGTEAENYPGNKPPTIERRFYPSSQDGSGDIRAISDQLVPVNSEDGSAPFLRLHPQTGDRAWVQYDFAKTATVSSVEIYWKDDKQYVVAPKSWRLLFKDGNEWKPVTTSGVCGVAKDTFNRVAFQPVKTSGLRIEIQLAPKLYKKGTLGPPDGNYLAQDLTWYEGGVIEWIVK